MEDSGRASLAVLAVKLEQLAQVLERHDTDNRRTLAAIHTEMRIDHDKLIELDGEVGRLGRDMDGVKREGRVVGTVASAIGILAAALGLRPQQ